MSLKLAGELAGVGIAMFVTTKLGVRWLAEQIFGQALTDRIFDWISQKSGIPASELSSVILGFAVPAIIAAASIWYAYKLGKREAAPHPVVVSALPVFLLCKRPQTRNAFGSIRVELRTNCWRST